MFQLHPCLEPRYSAVDIHNVIDAEIRKIQSYRDSYIKLNGKNEDVARFDSEINALIQLYQYFK